jgi:hypothetical protein
VAGSAIVFNEQHYYSKSIISKFKLYLVSIVPPIIVSQFLIKQFASETVIIVTVYLVVSCLLNLIVKRVNNSKMPQHLYVLLKFAEEAILFFIVLFIFRFIPSVRDNLPGFNLDQISWLGFSSLFSWYAHIFFIVIFNCVNYLSVEYIASILKSEINKPYIKNYFLYQNNLINKFFFIIKISLPEI